MVSLRRVIAVAGVAAVMICYGLVDPTMHARASTHVGPRLFLTDGLGKATHAGLTHTLSVGKDGSAYTAWSTGVYGGPSYLARVNKAGTKVTVIAKLQGRATGLAIGPSGRIYVTLTEDDPALGLGRPATILKLAPSGKILYRATLRMVNHTIAVSDVAVDSQGNAYVSGWTNAPKLATVGAYQPTLNGGVNAFVRKLDPDGKTVYSTYLGNDWTEGTAIAVDSRGDAYIAGATTSVDFPLVNPAQMSPGKTFVAELNPAGSTLIYSSYLGQDGMYGDDISDITVGRAGAAYVTGFARAGFPVTPHAFQARFGVAKESAPFPVNAFVTKFAPGGKRIVYSTYLGGEYSDVGNAIAVDARGRAVVVGETQSKHFPVRHPVQARLVQTDCVNADGDAFPCGDGFVAMLDPHGSRLVFSTYLGGRRDDSAAGVALNASGTATVQLVSDSYSFPALKAPQLSGIAVPRCRAHAQASCTHVLLATIVGIGR